MRAWWLVIFSLICGAEARAQDKVATDDMEKATLKDEKKEEGWKAKANVGLTGSVSSNRMFVGAEEGTSIQIGTVIALGADLERGQHRWENALGIQLAGSKTPQISRFVKSSDVLDLSSTYFYTLESVSWFGMFGRLKLSTQLLPTKLVRSLPYTVVRLDDQGVEIGRDMVDAQAGIATTGAFEPLMLRESLGIFVNPVESDTFSFKLKLGGAAQEIAARHGFVVLADDGAAATLTLQQVQSTFELGAELGFASNGTLVPEVLSWKLNVDLFQPFVTTANTDLSTIGQLNAEVVLGVSLKIVKWLSLEYLLTAKRIPLILDAWQIQNLLVLSAGFDLI